MTNLIPERKEIRILATGGTFDKEYNELDGSLFFKDTHLYEILRKGRCDLNISVRTLMMVDSLDMTTSDREVILHSCLRAKPERIIITHGTDTMIETAKLLKQHVKDKTVVLTGALIPYAFGTSDGFFNLGNAIGFVQSLNHGVYICMNGKVFDPDNVKKNYSNGFFQKIKQTTK